MNIIKNIENAEYQTFHHNETLHRGAAIYEDGELKGTIMEGRFSGHGLNLHKIKEILTFLGVKRSEEAHVVIEDHELEMFYRHLVATPFD